ncbi:thaumatin family protein [Hyalangium gracile]|uniref:thaumatin family protein n=1 Tax=Hyalangium gracile TaxID=394092 RepID=UPI001CCFA4A4|nr:thaumatin family protein [Hyalangium gracile]
MALSPLSPSSFSHASIQSTPRLEQSPAQPQARCGTPAPRQESALQKLLMSDGFDSPAGLTQAGGLQQAVQLLSQVATLLEQSARMLGSDFGGVSPLQGAQAGGVPDLGGAQCGVPDLGGAEGEVPDLGAQAGVPDLGAEAAPSSAAPSAPAQAQESAKVDSSAGVSQPKGSAKGERTMTFTNDGDEPMTVQFTPNAGEKPVDPVTLKPGETQTVAFPEGWCGNFRSTAGDGKAATLGEVKFNGGGNQTYYDVSYIEGNNAAMTIEPESGGRKSGTLENLLEKAPDAVKAKDGSGNVYGIKKTTTSNVQDGEVVDFFRKHVGADQGYVIPTDDASTLGTADSHLTVHLKNLT